LLLAFQTPAASPPVYDDRDAYAIYAQLLPGAWARSAKGPMIILEETRRLTLSCEQVADSGTPDPEWRAVEVSFRLENQRVRRLLPSIALDVPYRLVPRADVEADVRRTLEQRGFYPGAEAMHYVAVSAVGFNAAKTKAMVSIAFRDRGNLLQLERRDGKWVPAEGRSGCTWVA
jgi:hypothetical protein